MSNGLCQSEPPGFLSTVRILLRAARRRAAGRQKRQQELFRHRARKKAVRWTWVGTFFTILMTAILHMAGAFAVYGAVTGGERAEVEHTGKIVVRESFLSNLQSDLYQGYGADSPQLHYIFYYEARYIAREYGGSWQAIENTFREAVRRNGSQDFVAENIAAPGFNALPGAGRIPAMLGSIVLFWWFLMLTFQGEGLELDLQRRRHPMWEWLMSHPVAPGAIFTAEMLAPIAANPMYFTAPLFAGCVYGSLYGAGHGILAALAIGIPQAVAAAFLGKALEITVVLRLAPRSRGAAIGLMSWFGYASMILLLLGGFSISKAAEPLARFLAPLLVLPWPWLGLFLGQSGGSFSFLSGMLACWCASGLVIAGSIAFSVWGARQGLAGNFGKADSAPAPSKSKGFGKRPLYRKEILWFVRDRSAIVQTILIPLTISALQVFNLRGLLSEAQGSWNYLCGAGIIFGTYFLWILGPKSLGSEGNALWIALTWPLGLESLLKAKAWLWSLISTGIVTLVLLYTAYLFPGDAWKIVLVGVGWFFFGRSMAEKTVTLVRVTSASGEPEKISRNRQWAASLGMLTFSIGILTEQWHIAIMGIVYSYVTAAAMWENFRARIPFLYDPWSETLPSPPTLMHAMIAISILVEGGAVLTACALAFVGRAHIATVQTVIYGLCAGTVSFGLSRFLSNRGLAPREVWCWQAAATDGQAKAWWRADGTRKTFLLILMMGAAGGLALGLFAVGYVHVLMLFPNIADSIRDARARMKEIPGLEASFAFVGVFIAPLAEEYLFRGLLFRTLDREWGGWRAIIGSAAFFAVYHPLLAWVPVGLLGICNALVFKKTGRLAPAVALHMAYNFIVLSFQF